MTDKQLAETRELAYGMAVMNLNPDDVEDYMIIASTCARMECRRANQNMTNKQFSDVDEQMAKSYPE